jgi:hypothetical protein
MFLEMAQVSSLYDCAYYSTERVLTFVSYIH